MHRWVAWAGSSFQADGAVMLGRALGIRDDFSPVHFPLPHGDHEQRGQHHAAEREQAQPRYDAPIQVRTYPRTLYLQPLHLPRRHAVTVHTHVPRHDVGYDHQRDPGHQTGDGADEAVVSGSSGALCEGEVVLGQEGQVRERFRAGLPVTDGSVDSFTRAVRAGEAQVHVFTYVGEGSLQILPATSPHFFLACFARRWPRCRVTAFMAAACEVTAAFRYHRSSCWSRTLADVQRRAGDRIQQVGMIGRFASPVCGKQLRRGHSCTRWFPLSLPPKTVSPDSIPGATHTHTHTYTASTPDLSYTPYRIWVSANIAQKRACVVSKRAMRTYLTASIWHQFKVDRIVYQKPPEPIVEGA